MDIFTFTVALTALILAIVSLVNLPFRSNSARKISGKSVKNDGVTDHTLRLPASGTLVVELRGRVTFTVPPTVHGYVFVTTKVGDREFQHVVDTMIPEHYPNHAKFCHTFMALHAQSDLVTHSFKSSIPIENFQVKDEELVVFQI